MKKQFALIILRRLGLLAFLGTGCEPDKITVASSDSNNQQGITCSAAKAKATGTPDIAILSLGISTLNPRREARDQAATTMQALIDSVKGNGVAEKDIQSTQLSIYRIRLLHRLDSQESSAIASLKKYLKIQKKQIKNRKQPL